MHIKVKAVRSVTLHLFLVCGWYGNSSPSLILLFWETRRTLRAVTATYSGWLSCQTGHTFLSFFQTRKCVHVLGKSSLKSLLFNLVNVERRKRIMTG